MQYKKIPLKERNSNIQNISVVMNTLDAIVFPNLVEICKTDLLRFKLINTVQIELGNACADKESIYKFFLSYEQNI